MKGKLESIVTCEFTFDGRFETDDMGMLDRILKEKFSNNFTKIAESAGASHVTIKTQNFLHEEEPEKRFTYADHFFENHPNAPSKKRYWKAANAQVTVPICTRCSVYGLPGVADPWKDSAIAEWLEPYPTED